MKLLAVNPFVPNVPFLRPLKTSENLWLSDILGLSDVLGVEKGGIGNKLAN